MNAETIRQHTARLAYVVLAVAVLALFNWGVAFLVALLGLGWATAEIKPR